MDIQVEAVKEGDIEQTRMVHCLPARRFRTVEADKRPEKRRTINILLKVNTICWKTIQELFVVSDSDIRSK